MKKLCYLVLIISLTVLGCKKNSDTPPVPKKATSHWAFNGTSYNATSVDYDSVYSTLRASDDAGAVGGGNYVYVVFGAIGGPSTSITLTVVDEHAPANPSNCIVVVGNYYGAGYVSTGKAGDKVVVSVSSSGKLKVSFSNISVIGPTISDTELVSGTIIEN